ncbi:hypothetical protein [Aeromicrobium sp. 179-A 4D2 NHS]|uniref:hypothetical protein n=1 Tax=Aeromicrobium sp. 179-A 4D2 NHS TaxID=3142375 RepID=UPI00399F8929
MPIVAKKYVPRVEPVTIIEVTEENINEVIEKYFATSGLTVTESKDGSKQIAVAVSDPDRTVFETGDHLVFDAGGCWADMLDCASAVDEHYQSLT